LALPTIVIVDRDASTRARIREFLTANGFATREAGTIATLRRALDPRTSEPPDVVVADSSVTRDDHAALLAAIRAADELTSIVLLVRNATLEQATEAVRRGADHLLNKPVDLIALLIVVQRLVERQQSRRPIASVGRRAPDPFLGESRAIRQLAEQAHRILQSNAPILVLGETGTGKGVLASWLHVHGPRAEEPFVDINCASLSRELLESELFGHERGAFTGATGPKLGLFEVAHRGTVFLDEIGEFDLHLQPRLLKVLEDKRFRRLGDVRDRLVDVRLVAATNRDLAARSKDGAFRADLYYRINTITLTVPPLRERREDIPLLARGILRGLVRREVELAPDALTELVDYDWPGNIRELRNALDRALLVSNEAPRIARKHLQLEARETVSSGHAPDPFRPLTLDEAERRHVEQTLRFVGGSVDRAAVLLGVSRSALYKRIQRYRN
jgi:DNA-binding NtrC family response regulator